jgi:hypothetical protein
MKRPPETNDFLAKAQRFVELGAETLELGESLARDIQNLSVAISQGHEPDNSTALVAAITGVIALTEQLKDMGRREKQENN